MKKNQNRIFWLDVLKFIGILEIYIGHFGNGAGKLYGFVFTHHVALFFFVSGCLEFYNKDGFFTSVKKRAKGILIPWVFFSVISIVCAILSNHKSGSNLPQMVKVVALGCIRNRFFASGLWFLTALFVVSIMFRLLKMVKYRVIMLVIAMGIYLLTQTVMRHNPIITPSWPYNIDSALYYLIYYVLGYSGISLMQALFSSKRRGIKILQYSFFALSTVYTAALYFGKCLLRICGLYSLPVIGSLADVMRSVIVIFFFSCVAYELKNIKLLVSLGQETLYFCGNEYILRTVVPLLLSAIGLKFTVSTPITAIIFSFLLIFIGHKLLVPWQKQFISKISSFKFKRNLCDNNQQSIH